MEGASGGIILTASHNPKQWNALKLLNEKGEFLNAAEGQEVLRIAAAEEFDYAEVDQLGSYRQDLSYNQKHIDSVLALDLVDVEAIRKANFRVAIDCVNSVGGIILPQLLEQAWCSARREGSIANRPVTSSIIPSLWKRTWVTS